MSATHSQRLARLFDRTPLLRARDLADHGIPRAALRPLLDAGAIRRVGRGVYAAEAAELTENHSLAQAALAVPRGVICLLSALRLHGLTTQSPFEVWMTIGPKDRRPAVEYPPLRTVHASGPALGYGVERRTIEGVPVGVYSSAKTVADCFKFRSTIGLDVAIEALRDCLRRRAASPDEVHRAATVCRVANVMQPYLEAMA